MEQFTVKKIKEELKTVLNCERYEHTIGVMCTAVAMAARYDADMDKAMLAGLLHDCAKCIPSQEMLQMCEECQISVSETERQNPGLLHAKLGAYFAKTKYGIEDADILGAIIYHTTGCPDMSLIQKIVYIADYIEPNRSQAPNLPDIRRLAFQDIDECLYCILEATVDYLKRNKSVVDSITEETYLWYKNKRNQE